MARLQAKAQASEEHILRPVSFCWECMQPTRVASHEERRITHLRGMCRYILVVRHCHNRACSRYRVLVRPEAEGALALPRGEYGLDVMALVGQLRFAEHRSTAAIHQALWARQVTLAQRTVTNLVHRYEALLVLQKVDRIRLTGLLRERRQQRVVLAIDRLQVDQQHVVLWLLRDVLSGSMLLTRSLPEAHESDLVALLQEVVTALPVPVTAVLSAGQRTIRAAVQTVLPGVPHHSCQLRPISPTRSSASPPRCSTSRSTRH